MTIEELHKAPRVRSVPVTETRKEGQRCSEVLGGGRHLSDEDPRKVDGKAAAVVVTGYGEGERWNGRATGKAAIKRRKLRHRNGGKISRSEEGTGSRDE